jgi:Cdc6-like AAA superfamily ATPase
LVEKLAASDALLIKGPKSCGKTATAKQYTKSVLEMDRDPQLPVMMGTNPKLMLTGNTPRLIDEWQEQPEI